MWKAAAGQGSLFRGLASENQLFWTAGDRIVFPSELDGWLHLYAVPAGGGNAALLTPGEFEVEHVALSEDRKALVYSSNQGDIDRRHVWKPELFGFGSGRSRWLPEASGLKGLKWSPWWPAMRKIRS